MCSNMISMRRMYVRTLFTPTYQETCIRARAYFTNGKISQAFTVSFLIAPQNSRKQWKDGATVCGAGLRLMSLDEARSI